jgi:hypothetical protein
MLIRPGERRAKCGCLYVMRCGYEMRMHRCGWHELKERHPSQKERRAVHASLLVTALDSDLKHKAQVVEALDAWLGD